MDPKNHTSVSHMVPSQNTKPAAPQHSRPPESEPFSPSKDHVEIHEVVEHEITDKQVQPHVEVKKDVPQIPPDLQKMGVTTNATSSFSTYQKLKLPLDESKLPAALNSPLSESIRWLGEFTQYLIYQSKGSIQSTHKNIVANFFRMIGKDLGK